MTTGDANQEKNDAAPPPTAGTETNGTYARAMALVAGANLMVPLIGLATAPILAHSLGVGGRGEASAALAPNLLIVTGATIGLPPALTYILARRPSITRLALAWASVFSVVLGLCMLGVIYSLRFVLVQGDPGLADLVVLGTWLALPTLLVGLLRGAAYGRQAWTTIATERILNSVLRLVSLATLALLNELDVRSAVLVMGLAPVVAGVSYLAIVLRPPDARAETEAGSGSSVARGLLSFGLQEWLGSVAIMLIARMSQLLVTPLSDVEQLGLLVVAITVSDIPYIVTQAIREVVFGVNSAKSETARLLTTSRIVTMCSVLGSLAIGVTMPWWVALAFGAGFEGSLMPAWLLLASSCLAVPGLIAGAGLDALGKPAIRSWTMGLALVVNVSCLILLTPVLGAVGAALAALAGTVVSTTCLLVGACRALTVRSTQFWLPEAADLIVARRLMTQIAARFGGRAQERRSQ